MELEVSWRDQLFARLSPELLAGVTFGRWMRILADNRFSIDRPYWPRAAITTLFSLRNSAACVVENLVHGRGIRETQVESPLFILGTFRSGTTYLQNLLAKDSRFAFPSVYEVTFPQSFLTTRWIDVALFSSFIPRSRPQDRVQWSLDQPHEDEVALCAMLGRTFLFDMVFPRNTQFYRRYYGLTELSTNELEQWKRALTGFIRKLNYKHSRPLVLKSPGHTCRIATLLDMFPDAKFIHIQRDPIEVFQSWRHLIKSVHENWTLQRHDLTQLDEDIIQQYKQIGNAYLDQRDLIPQGNLHEITYDHLRTDPVGVLRKAYSALSLPDFEPMEASLQDHFSQTESYRQNEYPVLPQAIHDRLQHEWQRFFDAEECADA